MATVSKIRLLIVTPRYHPLTGGVEHHVREVTRRLVAQGVEVTVLTTDTSGKLPHVEEIEGATVRRVRAWPHNSDYYFAPSIYRIILEGNWNLIHCQSYHSFVAPLAMIAALRKHIPYIVTFHGGGHSSHLRHALRGIQRRLLRPLLAKANRLVAVAEFELNIFGDQLRIAREQFAVIPNGADLKIEPSPEPGNEHGIVIASIGRLERYKGHHRIIAAMPSILAQQPDARLEIVGAGPYESELHKLAARLGVATRVNIGAIPSTDRQRMANLLASSSVVTLLSEYETHPIVVLEALAMRRPVLVADTSGMSELAKRGLAQAIPINSSTEQVAAAILVQLRQPLIPPSFELPTWDDCAMALLTLYHEVLQ